MVNILISGALGRMGNKVYLAAKSDQNTTPVCGVDRFLDVSNKDFPVYDSFDKVYHNIDVVIDFSVPSNLDSVLDFAISKRIPVVLCTTGYSQEQITKIESASKKIAIFRSANMSLGVNVLIDLVKKAALALEDFDVEIIEKHHNQKVDAPSGTALMLADGVKQVQPEKFYVYGREGIVGKRDKNEIGIHAVRGGNIVGEHEVLFASENETITLYHQATDRAVFANGAIKAAIFIKDKTSGIYNMNDVINGK
ncbi:MAG: 4-hydroxy-tetrahydrodipicolinate reductase [Clostridia bacterium]|nr:4-hydroxy-tetrahydrodipicolinate reductase [Clostridia bacterium]